MASPTSSTYYCYKVTDSSTASHETATSATNQVTVLQRIASTELTALLSVYNSRPDLQTAFPEVEAGTYSNLVNWAYGVSTGKWVDSSYNTLAPYAYWYTLMYTYSQRPDLQAAFPNAYYSTGSYLGLINWAGGVVSQQWSDSSYNSLQPYGYWYALIMVYNQRSDLQAAYPNGYTSESYLSLINWAGGVVTHQWTDSSYSILNIFGYYYDLMMVYNARPDLQSAFLNAYGSATSFQNLVNWASGVVNNSWADSSFSTLIWYASWYISHAN